MLHCCNDMCVISTYRVCAYMSMCVCVCILYVLVCARPYVLVYECVLMSFCVCALSFSLVLGPVAEQPEYSLLRRHRVESEYLNLFKRTSAATADGAWRRLPICMDKTTLSPMCGKTSLIMIPICELQRVRHYYSDA